MASKKNKAALNSIKMQAANEVGVSLKENGYNGDLTSKQAGSVGGQMVKPCQPIRTFEFQRDIRIASGHKVTVKYEFFLTA